MDHDDEYAPSVFARTPEAMAASLTEKDLEAAMHRLLKAGRIQVDERGYHCALSHC